MNNIIEIKHLNKNYGKYDILKDVNLNLDQGKIVGLCGPNGAGKTTLIKILSGLLRAYEGEVLVDGQPIGKNSKALISYLPDIHYFDDSITAKKADSLYKDMYADYDSQIFLELLEKMKLDYDQPLKKMSKGMKEKFQLALCLSRQAEIYLIDEPIAGVDPASRDLIIETILGTYHEDALIIISTHLIQDIEAVLDEVIFLKEGEVMLHENCDELRERTGQSVNEVFREVFRWSEN
ncbi:MAG: ABC transporter ATP-binding protein [Erysipelothrix sp.]|nr:ABC transporter ATP-binding protein [Erysipelothrix sp.]